TMSSQLRGVAGKVANQCPKLPAVFLLERKAQYYRQQVIGLDGFCQMCLESGQQSFAPIRWRGIGSQSDCRNVPAFFPRQRSNSLNEFIPVLTCHADVADDYVRLLAFNFNQRSGARINCDYVGAVSFEHRSQQRLSVRVVFDNQNSAVSQFVVTSAQSCHGGSRQKLI